MLLELAKREKRDGIFPEKDVDVYMKVGTCIYSAGCWILCILVVALMNSCKFVDFLFTFNRNTTVFFFLRLSLLGLQICFFLPSLVLLPQYVGGPLNLHDLTLVKRLDSAAGNSCGRYAEQYLHRLHNEGPKTHHSNHHPNCLNK
jgi:hypothetical protein